MTDDNQRPSYTVGYRKTPEYTRFKPGQSGNPKGRPKGAKNLTTIVNNAIHEMVVINENGKRKSVSKLGVAVKQLVNKAAAGDLKALMQLLPLAWSVEGKIEADTAAAPAFAEADALVMAGIRERIRKNTLQELAKAPEASPPIEDPKQ